jgi:hypothetical protein
MISLKKKKNEKNNEMISLICNKPLKKKKKKNENEIL